jgi:A/G-specific adenine glycosylase
MREKRCDAPEPPGSSTEESVVGSLRRLLLAAYDEGKRNLPWRGETDPYRIWISEVMLQQTRVGTVIPYYEKWLRRFPDLDALASADEEDVLGMWQGLGYYSRARHLHRGARVVRERHGGTLPGTRDGLRELPGVGDYTAGAVASIAFGEVVPAVDGNVRRVLSRIFDLPDPSPAELRDLAETLVDRQRPGDFNQALMEHGALVCLPRVPQCQNCPVASECLALARGTVAERPPRRSRKAPREVDVAVLVAVGCDEEGFSHFLVRKRPTPGLLAGMWEFPGVEVAGVDNGPLRRVLRSLVEELGIGGDVEAGDSSFPFTALDVVTHVFSHLKARYRPFVLRVKGAPSMEAEPDTHRWLLPHQMHELPLPVAQRKIAASARAELGL